MMIWHSNVGACTAQPAAADQLRKLDFPRDVQAMVDEVIANRAALEAGLIALAASTDTEAANSALERMSELSEEGSEASNLVRSEFGST